jgi:hypothetical protein
MPLGMNETMRGDRDHYTHDREAHSQLQHCRGRQFFQAQPTLQNIQEGAPCLLAVVKAAAKERTALPFSASNIVGHFPVEIIARRAVLLQLQGCEPDDWGMQIIELERLS